MRLAFICAALEPGRDGVGDYSRRLAGELIRQGHPAVVVGLNDPYVSKLTVEAQEIEGTMVSVLRLPTVMPWADRASEAHKWLASFHADRISLQFVPFGFHPRGLRFGLGKILQATNTRAPWQIMFHELWLGLGENAKLRHRVIGLLQRLIILDIIGRLRPRIVHTQAEPYRIALRRTNIVATILPLFGNIPEVAGNGWDDLLEPLVREATGKPQDRSKLYLAGILGMVHSEWDVELTVNTLYPLVHRSEKRLVLVFHGKNHFTPEIISRLKSSLHDRADVVVTGERSAADISKILQALDIGLSTSPRQIIQKSGSVAAMLEHGLRVLVTRDDWHLRKWNAPVETASPGLIFPKQFSALKTLPVRDAKVAAAGSVRRVADQLLETFTKHST